MLHLSLLCHCCRLSIVAAWVHCAISFVSRAQLTLSSFWSTHEFSHFFLLFMIEWGHKLGLRPFNHSLCLYQLPSYPTILSHAYSISRIIVLWWKDLTCKSAIAHYCGLLCALSLLSLKLCTPQSHSLVTLTQLYSKSEKFPLFFSPPLFFLSVLFGFLVCYYSVFLH